MRRESGDVGGRNDSIAGGFLFVEPTEPLAALEGLADHEGAAGRTRSSREGDGAEAQDELVAFGNHDDQVLRVGAAQYSRKIKTCQRIDRGKSLRPSLYSAFFCFSFRHLAILPWSPDKRISGTFHLL